FPRRGGLCLAELEGGGTARIRLRIGGRHAAQSDEEERCRHASGGGGVLPGRLGSSSGLGSSVLVSTAFAGAGAGAAGFVVAAAIAASLFGSLPIAGPPSPNTTPH